MQSEQVVFSMFLVFSGAALFATVALYARQSLLVAYILLGLALGPWGLGWVSDVALLKDMAHIGIIFLLFLLGLHLPAQKLLHMFGEALRVTVLSSAVFALLGFAVAQLAGFETAESVLVGAAVMFSSTILGLKLLPTTILHHRHLGEVVISVLLLQDLIAIAVLLLLHGGGAGGGITLAGVAQLVASLAALVALAFVLERYVLRPLFRRFDRIHEFIFLVAIGWCLGLAQLAQFAGLSYEIGAFVAGVAIATGPIALYIAESLKPLRDFFLVLFFFALGAGFNLPVLREVWAPALLLAALILVAKPLVFRWLLVWQGEKPAAAWEIGVRLGQASEFALLIAYLAGATGALGERASNLLQFATLVTFIVSSVYVVRRFPTPIATSDRLRRD